MIIFSYCETFRGTILLSKPPSYLGAVYWLFKALVEPAVVIIVEVSEEVGLTVGYNSIPECINSETGICKVKRSLLKRLS